jgi:kinesin family protein 3/17
MAPKGGEAVKVVVRIRPLSSKEKQDGHEAVAEAFEDRGLITVRNPKSDSSEPPKSFTFDAVFSSTCTQRQIYDTCAAPIVKSALEGYNGTVFAYGQTGAGKTHTMEGEPDPPNKRGIIPNAFQHIFDHVALGDDSGSHKYLVRASYFEIYQEEIRDLLSKDPKNRLELKESSDSGVYVKDLTSFVVKSTSEIDHVMQAGKKNRSVGETLMNQASSRSHSVFTIVIECCVSDERGEHIRVGKLNLVDLAGSERQSKTGATGDRLKEATKINLSLSALGNVISALIDGKSQHIPYRDSKLTRILQDSLGGNTKTVMCANAGPAEYNYDETISTLRYANRAKNIKNKPKINEDPKDAMLREYQEEIQRLKAQLMGMGGNEGGGMVTIDGQEININNIKGGVSEEYLKELQQKADLEKEEIKRRAEQEMKELMERQDATEGDKRALKEKLEKESKARMDMENQRLTLQNKLKAMEEKLIVGGEMASKAAKQEAELRKAEQELAARKESELGLARQMAEQEEQNLLLEEKYGSLQDEVDAKTKKLKKLWSKFQQTKTEIKDITEEHQVEKQDMLETIRDLTRQLKLKEVIIHNFVPPEEARQFDDIENGGRAVWKDEAETWVIPRAEITGNALRPSRHVSASGLKRPETEYSRHRKQYDTNPRYKYDNTIALELDMPERTTQDYEGPSMVSRISPVLSMSLADDNDDEVQFSAVENSLGNPYLQYQGDGGGDGGRGERENDGGANNKSKEKSKSKSGKKDRPSTATRRKKDKSSDRGGGGHAEAKSEYDFGSREEYK